MTPAILALVATIIVAVWGILLGTAYAARVLAGWNARGSLAAVTIAYLVLTALALLWLGWGTRGWLGAAGMLAPYAAAVALVMLAPKRTAPDRP